MKLIGSTTSPYVRKIRLLLANVDYQFETLKALGPEASAILEKYGPVKRIPILIDNEKQIFDSSIICEYLLEKNNVYLSIDEKLNLKLIDELCDACIALFQQRVWKIDRRWESEFSIRMLNRAFGVLDMLESLQANEKLNSLQKDWLYCVLDWLSFRSVIDWRENRSSLSKFYDESKTLGKYVSTKLED